MLLESIHILKPRKIYNYKSILFSSELTNGSDVRVKYNCDLCGNEYEVSKKNYIKTKNKNNGIDICYNCSLLNRQNRNLSKEEVIEKANKIHSNKYDYSKLEFKNVESEVIIGCKEHGDFKIKLDPHLYRFQGCPKCSTSKGETIIRNFLENKNIKYIQEHTFNDLKRVFKLRFDFYIPEMNLAIEFDGDQHGKYSPYIHRGFCNFLKQEERDMMKNKYCEEKGITLKRFSNYRTLLKQLNTYFYAY